jgi:23S rRNA (adenine2503-C2)-methyltransferase
VKKENNFERGNNMKIIRNIQVPTGNICIAEGEKGKLEFLSLGDYGKEKNVKANFLGLSEDINGVPGGEIMPLEEKWVITISSQYGCSMGCKFCDVPKVGPGLNATSDDMLNQIDLAVGLHPEVEYTERLNVHYARMGEPTFNPDVIWSAIELRGKYGFAKTVHPVVSTMLPKKNKDLKAFLTDWCKIKNGVYNGEAGLQFSINSTSDEQREDMFNGSSLRLEEISKIADALPMPKGRKYALNFALADGYEVDARRLRELFHPDKFMVKITPLHATNSCEENHIQTTDGYEYFTPYKQVEQDLIDIGFDVLVFIPSYDEDQGRITCGNAILSGTEPLTEFKEM